MTDRPHISVVIPVKDDAAHLERCLSALGRQTIAPSEIVVVDNVSSDASDAVARIGGARVVREQRPGIPAAASTGYDQAEGEVIARLDADSIPADDWIERIGDRFRDRPDLAAVTGGASFSGGPRALRRVGAALYLGAYHLSLAPALGHVPLFGSNFAMRRSEWQRVSGTVHRKDSELHDDLDLAFHLGVRGRIRYGRGLSVQISSRPFAEAGTLPTRFRRGFRTVLVHWPRELPWLRWSRRVIRRHPRLAAAVAPAGARLRP
ncbi:glycosyltransferase [Herbiconiux sp. CPCC 203407]|uniref:4,4'-diaponeurosporenoate glycosyltransferase n=1 Tax=Herbiconiux oxytropis TaxID=2970915 RepID=A0AA41XBV0_9MICO|nr:glycosyltransferase family 2 protein [Herbiconiux oxytropis]MCS5722659.1 glycosyltransferase [Herbiconiux oxytropis]MCS5725356.1 glycosyltransferase [Herbiconiux oxytropis]